MKNTYDMNYIKDCCEIRFIEESTDLLDMVGKGVQPVDLPFPIVTNKHKTLLLYFSLIEPIVYMKPSQFLYFGREYLNNVCIKDIVLADELLSGKERMLAEIQQTLEFEHKRKLRKKRQEEFSRSYIAANNKPLGTYEPKNPHDVRTSKKRSFFS